MTTPAAQAAPRFRRLIAAAAVSCALLAAGSAHAQIIMKEEPEELRGIDVAPRLGSSVPLEAPITDSKGDQVVLGRYFNQGRPVVLALVYYDCPMMCPLMLSRLQERLNQLAYTVGRDFNVVVVSFDPTNTTKMAADNKAAYLAGYSKPVTPEVEAGWTFHTATMASAREIADSVGFRYKYFPESGEYGHPAVLTVLTAEGVVSGYVSGLEPEPNDLRLALLRASEGKIARGLGDFFLHRCYIWDPKTGKYTLHAFRIMQMGGLLTVMGVATLIAALRAGERARAWRRAARSGAETTGAAAVAEGATT